jgi:DNA excision repair protein ERCC-6-like
MGLGKTCQTSVYLKGLFEAQLIRKVLIVVPSTLKLYWKEEIKRWTKGLTAIVLDGQKKSEREKSLKHIKKKGGILITSFGLVTTERCLLTDIRYDILIMDEGHKAKNVNTELRKNVMRLTVKYHRILLTGTPLQNNLQELWSVFDCVEPNIFGSFQNFTKEFAVPIEKGLTKDATTSQKSKSKNLSIKLRKIYQAFFLRRTKSQIFKVKSVEATGEPLRDNELPLKTDLVIWLDLSESQKDMYEYIISRDSVKNIIASGAFINAF